MAFHFFVNLRTDVHFDVPPVAASERTRQKYAPFASIVGLLTAMHRRPEGEPWRLAMAQPGRTGLRIALPVASVRDDLSCSFLTSASAIGCASPW